MTHERASDGIIPLLFTTDFIDKRSGTTFFTSGTQAEHVNDLLFLDSFLRLPALPRIMPVDRLRLGADFGSFRPTVHEDEGGYQMTFDDEIRCKAVIPFQVGLLNDRSKLRQYLDCSWTYQRSLLACSCAHPLLDYDAAGTLSLSSPQPRAQ